jgi:succinate dehydrogenase/fumarate reductase cytochrome b subunit
MWHSIMQALCFLVACVFAYHSYNAFRSAITGTPYGACDARDTRLAAMLWGAFCLGTASFSFWMLFQRYY